MGDFKLSCNALVLSGEFCDRLSPPLTKSRAETVRAVTRRGRLTKRWTLSLRRWTFSIFDDSG